MVDSSNNKKRKEFISETDIATLLQRYDHLIILKLLQEMHYYAESKMDWNELVKKTSTGITNAREYQLLWRHLAYRNSLLPVEDNAQLRDDDSDMECELEASPAVSVDVAIEAAAHVKVIAASYMPSESDIPEDSTVEAPLTINIPYVLHTGAQEPSDSFLSTRGMNITFPVSLLKAPEGHNGNGLGCSMAPRKRRKKWSAEEDEELITAVKRHGEGSWAFIAKEEFEGERTAAQLSQRWGAIRRRCDTSNTSTQTGLQRTEAQMAANRALSLAVGNRAPSKKLAVGTPPMLSSGTIKGAQANGANSTLQSQQQSQPQVQALPRAATLAPTTKSRVPAKKTTVNSTLKAELVVTANSAAAAACMSGLETALAVPKIEPAKNAVSALVSKAEPLKTASAASLPRPSGISLALTGEPLKTTSAASLPRPSGVISAPKTVPLKSVASAASLPHPSGIISASKAAPVKIATSAASLPRPSGIVSTPMAQPVKTAAFASSLPRPSAIVSAAPVKTTTSAASFPRPSATISAPKAGPVKSTSAASLDRPSAISAPKAEPAQSVLAAATNTKAVGPLNLRHVVNGSPNHAISSPPPNKPSPMAPLSKGSTIPNSSVPTHRLPAANIMPKRPSLGETVNASTVPVSSQKNEQAQGNRASTLVTATLTPNKTISTNSGTKTGNLVAAKEVTLPSPMPKKSQVVGSCNNKSSPEKESRTGTLVVAVAESKPKDE